MEPTLSEVVVRKSIRKYFVDALQTGLSIPVYFDKIEKMPDTIDSWVSVQVDTMDFSTMATIYLQIYCFTRKDSDFTKLALLRDKVFDKLIDLTQTNGIQKMDMYDTDWVTPVAHALLIPQDELANVYLDDDTNCKVMPVLMRFGAK